MEDLEAFIRKSQRIQDILHLYDDNVGWSVDISTRKWIAFIFDVQNAAGVMGVVLLWCVLSSYLRGFFMDEPTSIVLCEDHIHSEQEVVMLDWLDVAWKRVVTWARAYARLPEREWNEYGGGSDAKVGQRRDFGAVNSTPPTMETVTILLVRFRWSGRVAL